MIEPRNPPDDENQPPAREAEMIARLLHLAGPRPEPPREAAQRVREAVRARWLEVIRARRRRRAFGWLGGALAAAALIVVGFSVAGRRATMPPAPVAGPAGYLLLSAGAVHGAGGGILAVGSELPPGAILQTAADARAAIRLPGGAVVRMDRQTRIVAEGGSLIVLESGALYVDTDAQGTGSSAVEVRTSAGLVRDVGTRFEVRMAGGALRVRVRHGAVDLERSGKTWAVPAGEELSVGAEGEPAIGPAPSHGPEWDWVLDASPEFALEGRTLGEFLDWLSSETGLAVRFSGEVDERKALAIVLHGSVAGLRPDQAPGAVLPTCGLSHSIGDGAITIGPASAAGARQEGAP